MFRKIVKSAVVLFALIGLMFTGVFFAIRSGWTNVPGQVDKNDDYFKKLSVTTLLQTKDSAGKNTMKESANATKEDFRLNDIGIASLQENMKKLDELKKIRTKNYCKVGVIGQNYPSNAARIISVAEKTRNDTIVTKAIAAAELAIMQQDQSIKTKLEECEDRLSINDDFFVLKNQYLEVKGTDAYYWTQTPEWASIKEATLKDKEAILRASEAAGVEPRLIVSNMIVEQLRLFNSQRQVFKQYFEPLKILCSANKISFGVMGIKEATAIQIENNLKDRQSDYYLGDEFTQLLDYPAQIQDSIDSQRFKRLTDEKDHYYSYLYGGLYLKQLITQWQKNGYSIDWRPEIIGTLYNVGFPQSHPNAQPKTGGSVIQVGEREYTFGSLAYEFYYSGELIDDFPYQF